MRQDACLFSKAKTLRWRSNPQSPFRYGDPNAIDGPTSLKGSLWGEASHEFASSLRGDIKLVASAANTQRVFGAVELPATANNPNVTSLAGMPRAELAVKLQQLGPDGVIAELQDQFITATPRGLFTLPVKEGERPSRVIASREFGDAIEVDSRRLSTASELHFAGLPVAPTGLGQVQPEWETARANYLSDPTLPKLGRAGTTAGLAGLGALAAAYDAKETGERLGTAYAQDNPAAVRSEATHFAARGVGGLAAGVTPVAAGMSGGPALALAVADGILLTEAFDRGAQFLDRNRIVYQTDRDGVEWEFTGKQWIRDDLRADLRDDGMDKTQRQTFAALPDKARELSYQASVEAVSQAIGKTDPRDPFVQPANDSDPAHFKVRDWTRDSSTGQWSRMVADDVDRNDTPQWKSEDASAARAADLDREALRTIDKNIVEGPAGLAAQYQLGHKRSGFDTAGEEPPVVKTALNPDTLEASNGKQYQRDAQGQWSHDGEIAQGNRALELEVTRERIIPALEHHQVQLAETPPWKPPTAEEQDRAMLREAYVAKGLDPTVKPEQFEASYLAVQRTRETTGVTAETTSLVLGPNANGQFTIDSPIHHLREDADGVVRIAAATTPDDIALARNEVRTRALGDDAPQQTSPERTIKQATPEERDAREQAQREANRQGLSQEDAQQAVHAAAVGASVRGIAPAGGAARVTGQEQEDSPQAQRERAQDVSIAHGMPQAAAKIEPATTLERQNETQTPASADREPQDARTAATPAPNTTHDPDALRLGSRGDSVELLQYRLDRQGYSGPDGEQIPQTGQYGPETEHAVRQFQTMHGIPATGIADQDTRDAVDRSLAVQREHERGEQGNPNRSPSPESTPARETPEPAIAARTVGLSASGGREAEDRNEREPQHAARAEAQPAALATTAPDPALAHRTATHDDNSQAPDKQTAPPLLDNPAHPNHGMYATLLEVVHERDHALGRTPDEHSKQLAGALTERALSQGLTTIGAAKFSDDGKVVGMTDTPNLSAEWARTSAGNAAEMAGRPLAQSSEGAAKLTEQMEQARALQAQTQTQTPPTQDDPTPKGPKL